MEIEGIDIYSEEPKKITIENGVIADIQSIEANSCHRHLSRGFFDMQINGYNGIDYSSNTLDIQKIQSLTKMLGASGTTKHVPTIITNSKELICKNLRTILDATISDSNIYHAIPAIHVEGPFISKEDGPRGAHDISFIRDPSIEELDAWQEASGNLLKLITIAPEAKNALEFTKEAVSRGIRIAIGHANPSDEQIDALIEAGATLSTHLGNGSHALLPRLKNHIWKQVADDRLTAGIISDGFHVPQSVLKTFLRTKGIENIILVSDATLLGGKEPGQYRWGNIDVEVFRDGHLGLLGTAFLAGAGHLLDWDIKVFMDATGLPLNQVIPAVTINPAKALGVSFQSGDFQIGEPANLIAFSVENNRLHVTNAWMGTNYYEGEPK
jgi:N-acetylglucosamine-6-phosphate deacetylase